MCEGRRRLGDRHGLGAVPRARSGAPEVRMTGLVMVDLRNIYRPEEVTAHGFTYHGVGRGTDT
jgi:hypothetical protein